MTTFDVAILASQTPNLGQLEDLADRPGRKLSSTRKIVTNSPRTTSPVA